MPHGDFSHGDASNFPASVDQFPILQPYASGLSVGAQAEHALEQAEHLNLYWDALYNIEVDQLNKIGGPLSGFYPKNSGLADFRVSRSDFPISYVRQSGTLTTTTSSIQMTGMVPIQFGDNPFDDPTFSIFHTTYATNAASADLTGLGAGGIDPAFNLWNNAMALPGIHTMVHPTGGRNYTVTVTDTGLNPLGTGVFEDTRVDSLDFPDQTSIQSNPDWTLVAGGNMSAATAAVYATINSTKYMALRSEYGDNPRGGLFSTSLGEVSDARMEFAGPVEARGRTRFIENNEVWNRVGFFIRMTGVPTNCSMYALVIGDWPENDAALAAANLSHQFAARVVKISGLDITDYRTGSSGGEDHPTWDNVVSITEIASHRIDLTNAGPYRFTVTGSSIDVEEFNGSWSSVIGGPVGDATQLPGPGKFGVFTTPLDDAQTRESLIPADITASTQTATDTDATIDVELTFIKVGDSSNATFRSV